MVSLVYFSKERKIMGWLKGLEPSTTGITILLSVWDLIGLTCIRLDIMSADHVIAWI
jgi:hypothetical protein